MAMNTGHPGTETDLALTRGGAVLPILLAAFVSILLSGYIPFFNNNIYHLTILNADYDLPQFAGDPVVQSLRHFSSGFWMLFAGIGHVVPVKLFLAIAFILSRIAFFAAALHLAKSLGYRGKRFGWIFLLLLATTPLMSGYAPGGGGLNINYFSHSELANVTLVFSLSLLLRRQFGPSAFFVCVTFFLNAFMAVWLAPIWAAVAVTLLAGEGARLFPAMRSTALGIFCGLPLVALVVKAVMNGSTGYQLDYSYAAYLRGFFPYHFFLDSLERGDLVQLALMCLLLPAISVFLTERNTAWLALAIGTIGLLAVGSLLPLVTENRMVLNLHFIRSAVVIQLFTALGLGMVAANGLAGNASLREQIFATLIGALMLFGNGALAALPLALGGYYLYTRGNRPAPLLDQPKGLRLSRGLLLAASVFTVTVTLSAQAKGLPMQWRIADTWERAGAWVNENTPQPSSFLLPVTQEDLPPGADPASQYLDFEVTGFVASAHRPVWTSFKYGAAPMWAPQTHAEWNSRYQAAMALKTTAERFAYARAHAITHVATFCDPAVPDQPIYRDGDLCIYAMNP